MKLTSLEVKSVLAATAAAIAVAVALTGCQTRVTATKFAENPLPIQHVVQVNGQDQVIVDNYLLASGGWEFTARSPLYAVEALNGLEMEVSTNGSVRAALNSYHRDLSTNAVEMVDTMFKGATNLVSAVGVAYAKIAGGASVDVVSAVSQKVYSAFVSGGGNADAATVTTDGDTLKVSDGSICTTCTVDGECTTGSCYDS